MLCVGYYYFYVRPVKIKKDWPKDNFPFTNESSPISIKAYAKKIPNWKIDEHNLTGELIDSPIESIEKTEIIEVDEDKFAPN